jgi:hypothetical protein
LGQKALGAIEVTGLTEDADQLGERVGLRFRANDGTGEALGAVWVSGLGDCGGQLGERMVLKGGLPMVRASRSASAANR